MQKQKVSKCSKLAHLEYKKRHDKVAGAVHWSLCETYHIKDFEQWYQHTAEPVIETQRVKILWDINIQTDHVIEHRRPDIVVVDIDKMRAFLIDIAVPGDATVEEKEQEKMDRFQDLARELEKQKIHYIKCARKLTIIHTLKKTATLNLKQLQRQAVDTDLSRKYTKTTPYLYVRYLQSYFFKCFSVCSVSHINIFAINHSTWKAFKKYQTNVLMPSSPTVQLGAFTSESVPLIWASEYEKNSVYKNNKLHRLSERDSRLAHYFAPFWGLGATFGLHSYFQCKI